MAEAAWKTCGAFNDEKVVRAIFASEIPVVSAVGHEIDVTLADFVADVRAATPTEAAERLVPSSEELLTRLIDLRQRLVASLRSRAAQWPSPLGIAGSASSISPSIGPSPRRDGADRRITMDERSGQLGNCVAAIRGPIGQHDRAPGVAQSARPFCRAVTV